MKYLLFLFNFIFIACSGEDSAGWNRKTEGGEEEKLSRIVIHGNFSDTVVAYLFNTEEPYQAIDSTRSMKSIVFPNTLSNYSYCVYLKQKSTANLLQNLKNGDSIQTTLKPTSSYKFKLISNNDSIISAQQAFTPYPQPLLSEQFTAHLLTDSTELQINTPSQRVLYSLKTSKKQVTLTPTTDTSLELQLTDNLIDYTLWQNRFLFDSWDRTSQNIPSIYTATTATLSTILTTQQENGKTLLDFDKDAYLSTPLELKEDVFSMMITFKTNQENTGLFQFSKQANNPTSSSTDWQAYVQNKEIQIQFTAPTIDIVTISSQYYTPNTKTNLLIQFDQKNGLTIWVNGQLVSSKPLAKSFGIITPTHFQWGYSNVVDLTPTIPNPYYKGILQELSFYSRTLQESEIQALENW